MIKSIATIALSAICAISITTARHNEAILRYTMDRIEDGIGDDKWAVIEVYNPATDTATMVDVKMRTTEPITANIYPHVGIVTDIDCFNDVVDVTDINGNTWQFYGVEDWQENDICACIMFDNNTDDISDDEILKAEYKGHMDIDLNLEFMEE
jgi:hypothetical protein